MSKNELVVLNPIEVFSEIEGMDLPTLQVTYAKLPDIETEEGYKFIAAGLKEVSGLIKNTEDVRVDEKAPALNYGRALDKESSRIKDILIPLRDKMRDLKKEYDGRKKRQKEELESKIQTKIDEFSETVNAVITASSQEVSDAINAVGEVDVSHGFYHRTAEAAKARNNALDKLTDLLTQAVQKEDGEKRLAELEEAQARHEKEEIEREVQRLKDQLEMDHTIAMAENIIFDQALKVKRNAEEVQRKADEEAQQKRDKEIADKAAEAAVIAAEEAATKAESDRIAAKEKADQDAIDAAAKAESEKEEAVQKAKAEVKAESDKKAKAREDKRIADAKTLEEENRKRAENLKHRKEINNKVLSSMLATKIGKEIGEENLKKLMGEIAKKNVNFVTINY